jgi:FtsZ-binding cell division protein ZapB
MKNLLIFLLISTTSFAQNKKEQIEILNFRVDSLNTVLKTTRANSAKDISILNDKIKEISEEVTALQGELTTLQASNNELSKGNEKLKTDLGELSKENDKLKTDLGELSKKKLELEAKLAKENTPTLEPAKELTTVFSIGGQGKNVDYRGYDLEKLFELDDIGPFGDSYFINGCDGGSVECKVISASSTLDPNKTSFRKNNLIDQNPLTAWVEGNEGYGIGSYFEISCNNLNTIYNGYQNSPSNWLKNSRVKKFKVYIDGKPLCFLVLKDEMGEQNFELPFDADWETAHIFKFEIFEVYEGEKYSDVCISEIGVQGCCFSIYSKLKSPKGEMEIAALNDNIYSFDIKSKTLSQSYIESKILRRKAGLYEITVGSYKTLVTREHRLLTKDHGSLSIMEMLSNWKYSSYEELQEKRDLQIALFVNGEVIYKSITKIKRIEGDFLTVSIRKLSKGKHVIVDGFIQEIE